MEFLWCGGFCGLGVPRGTGHLQGAEGAGSCVPPPSQAEKLWLKPVAPERNQQVAWGKWWSLRRVSVLSKFSVEKFPLFREKAHAHLLWGNITVYICTTIIQNVNTFLCAHAHPYMYTSPWTYFDLIQSFLHQQVFSNYSEFIAGKGWI